jgi:hypothetical protein
MKFLYLSVTFNPQVSAKMKCDLWLKLSVCCHPIKDATNDTYHHCVQAGSMLEGTKCLYSTFFMQIKESYLLQWFSAGVLPSKAVEVL